MAAQDHTPHEASAPHRHAAPSSGAIDIHHHILPPFYKPVAQEWLRRFASNVDDVLAWTPERSLDAMDRAGVRTAVLSISAPGIDFGRGIEDVALARECNDYSARLARTHAERFRYFTALPMPDVDASMAEAERGLAMGAVGIGLMSSYAGRYLGDAQFAPLFDMLNRRKTVIYVHPTMAPCCVGMVPEIIDPLIEFPVDTGRTIASLLWSGTLSRCTNLRFVFSHGGGIAPTVIERIAAMAFIDPAIGSRAPISRGG